jgi:hypothetical protein
MRVESDTHSAGSFLLRIAPRHPARLAMDEAPASIRRGELPSFIRTLGNAAHKAVVKNVDTMER